MFTVNVLALKGDCTVHSNFLFLQADVLENRQQMIHGMGEMARLTR